MYDIILSDIFHTINGLPTLYTSLPTDNNDAYYAIISFHVLLLHMQ